MVRSFTSPKINFAATVAVLLHAVVVSATALGLF